jgi:hypothetical protein
LKEGLVMIAFDHLIPPAPEQLYKGPGSPLMV